jgi:hypothetical protein
MSTKLQRHNLVANLKEQLESLKGNPKLRKDVFRAAAELDNQLPFIKRTTRSQVSAYKLIWFNLDRLGDVYDFKQGTRAANDRISMTIEAINCFIAGTAICLHAKSWRN